MKKVYIVVKLTKNDVPEIVGVYADKKKAESVKWEGGWYNVIEKEVIK